MKKLLISSLIFSFLFGLMFVAPTPKPAGADFVQPTVVSISMNGVPVTAANGVIDMSVYTTEFPMWKPEANGLFATGWIIQNTTIPVGSEFQVVLDTKMQEPQIVVMQGDIASWSYDATTGYTTINGKSIIIPGRDGGPDTHGLITAVVLSLTADSPKEVKGVYISTNAYEWDIIPPSDKENPKFGFRITGKDGYEDGFFKMYIPKPLLDLMHTTAAQMGVYVDGTQTSISVLETADGGALISISLHYSTREITAGKALPLSLAADKTSIKKGKKTALYGWLGTKKKGKTVELYKKEKGETSYTMVAKLTTKKNGYFTSSQSPTKNTNYKALYKKPSGKKVWSPVQKVKVK